MSTKALIFGCAGLQLSEEEIHFFREHQPWGFILFGRNIESRQQVVQLTSQMRQCVGRDNAPILIDEEGGRVQRLRPPHWCSNPPGRLLGELYGKNQDRGKRAAWLQSRLIAHDLGEIGVNVDCLPVLDVPIAGAHDAIGDRAYSFDPDIVAIIGKAVIEGLLAGGVLPIVKHMPGHGRSFGDSHHELPRVDAGLEQLLATDFKPFAALNDAAMAMTAHIIFEAIDRDNPATTSPVLIKDIIRGHIGFDGLLMSDDVSMNALSGDYATRTQSIFAAGVDIVLHCNGLMDQMIEVAGVTPVLTGNALDRANLALSQLQRTQNVDVDGLRGEFDQLISELC